jgi:hypothetical protein
MGDGSVRSISYATTPDVLCFALNSQDGTPFSLD